MRNNIMNAIYGFINMFKIITGQLVLCPVYITVDAEEQKFEDNGMINYCE